MPRPLLESTASEGARLVALQALDHAAAAAARLDDPSDAEALHDLRVSLRKLRSGLRAYAEVLDDAVPRRHRRRLARLAARTGPARDAEVQLALLETLLPELDAVDAAGVEEWLRSALLEEGAHARDVGRSKLTRRFTKLDRALRERLGVYTLRVDVVDPKPELRFADLVAAALLEAAERLRESLGALAEDDDLKAAHRARIAGKRLRYLTDPFRDAIPETRGLLRELRRLQDELGEVNDLHVLSGRVGRAIEEAAVDGARRLRAVAEASGPVDVDQVLRSDARHGLLALLRRIAARRGERLGHIREAWLVEGGLERMLGLLPGLVARLAPKPSLEIERKYLLNALPPACEAAPSVELDQGYLPGERLIERIRRKRTPEGETYVRTVKLGEGLVRIEVEESCSREVFEPLWVLTEGRRVRKRRYRLEAGEHVWEIDAFLDRALFLAEVELESADAEAPLPEWLAPHVEREVTNEPEFVNANLAR